MILTENTIKEEHISCNDENLSLQEREFYNMEFTEEIYNAALEHMDTALRYLRSAEMYLMEDDNLAALGYLKYGMIHTARALLKLYDPEDKSIDVMNRFDRTYVKTGIVYSDNFFYWYDLGFLLKVLAFDACFEVSEDQVIEALEYADAFFEDVDYILSECAVCVEDEQEEYVL